MKLGYFADGPWAHKALEKILENENLQVAFIVARYDKADPVLREYADRLNIPYYLHPNVNSHDFIQMIGNHLCDVHVSMSFNQILKKEIINSTPKGFINCHAGALPFYRGRNILNWALINGEKQFGVTVHYIDEGIDTGDIILQQFAEITDNDDYASLLEKAIDLCASILPAALLLMAQGTEQRIQQNKIHPIGFYCSQRRLGDEWIDWAQPSFRIHNFVRAITLPGPGARTYRGNMEVAILKTELIDQAPSYLDRPGSIVGLDQRGVIVKTADTVLRVTKIADIAPTGTLVNTRIPKFMVGSMLGLDMSTLMKSLIHAAQIKANIRG